MNKLVPTETAKFFQTEHIDEIFHKGFHIHKGLAVPLEIEISVIDSCTRTCHCCPRGNDEIAPKTSIKFTKPLWTKLSTQLKEIGFNGLVMLSGFGEALLHPRLNDIVKAFSWTHVDMNTNGDLLTRDKVKEIIDFGINKIMISIYEKEKSEYFVEMTKGYEDHVIFRNRYENFDRLFNNRGGAVYQDKPGGICYYPFYLLMVDGNGDVYPCCHEWQRKLKMGNLYQHDLWEIWTSESLRRVRREILKSREGLFPCRKCNVNGTYRGKNNFDFYTKGYECKDC